jgi:Methyltransferase domain
MGRAIYTHAMKCVRNCVICGSCEITKKIGQFAPFISHRVFDYPIGHLIIGDQPHFPFIITNALRCNRCGFVFSQLRFDDEEMASIYRDYRGESYVKARNIFEPGYADMNVHIGNCQQEVDSRQRAMHTFLEGVVDRSSIKTVLDYGGDKGQHIPKAFSECKRYVYDISNVGTIDGIAIVNDLTGLGNVDFIMAANVFEHLPYPGDAITNIKKVCGKNTVFFVDVPLEMNNSEVISEAEMPSFFHEHINFFTSKSLIALMVNSGFRPLKIEVIEMDFGWTKAKSLFIASAPLF